MPSNNELFCSFVEENNFLKKIEKKFYMFNREQITKIYNSMVNIKNEINYKIYNILTRLCSKPWSLDPFLFKHGICYYGNFGEHPSGYDATNLIKSNYENLLPRSVKQFEQNCY